MGMQFIHEPQESERLSAMPELAKMEDKERAEELERRNHDLKILFEIGQTLSRLAPLSDTLETVYTVVAQALDAHSLYIALFDEAKQEIHFPIYTMNGKRRPPITRPMANGITEHILRTEAPIWIKRDLNAVLSQMGIQMIGAPSSCYLGVPIRVSDRTIGVIAIQDNEKEDVYTIHDQELLSTIASQVGSAIENSRLYDQAQNRAKEFQTLYQTTHTLALGSDLLPLLQSVIEQAAELLHAPAGGILLYNPERNVLELTARAGLPLQIGTTIELNEGFAGQVFQTLQTLTIDNYGAWDHRISQLEKFELRSVVGVPLMYHGEAIGVLQLAEVGTSTRKFSESDQRLLALFASQVASAVHNARLLAETQQRAREFETLHQVTRDLNSFKELPELLQTILDRATDLFRTTSGSITLYDPISRNLRMAAVREFPIPIGTLSDLGKGMAGMVSQKREPLIIPNYSTWESRMPATDGIPFNAALCVPMIYRGELIGTLAVMVRNDPARKFAEADARLLSLFGSHAASAVYETRLFEETRTRADQMALLYDAGLTLNRVLDPKMQREFLLKLAVQSLKADRAIFYRYDSTERTLQAETAVGYEPSTCKQIRAHRFPQDSAANIPSWVLEHRLPVNLGTVANDARYDRVDPKIQSGLWVPIEHENRARGVLCVFSTRAAAFNAQDERLLTLYANQLSTALGNAELFGDTRQRLSELEAINKLSTTLRAARSIADMLPLFLHQTLAIFESDAGSIWLYNPITKMLEQGTSSGWFAHLAERSIGPGKGIAGHVFSTGKLHLSSEFLNDSLSLPSAREHIPAGWGGACVPIRSADGIVGVLFVAVRRPRQLNEPEAHLLTTLAEIAGNTIHRMHLHESLQKTFVETVAALAHAIDARDAYTAGHSNNVSDLAVELAAEVGLPSEEREMIRLAGLLHDIGKIAIPDAILHKPGRLTLEEYALVKTHPQVGAQILESIEQLKPMVPIVLSHQERFDGTGYPNGLARKEIPIGARVLSIVDAYSAIIDHRAYRPARSKAQAMEEIRRCSGQQFDPEIVTAFSKVVARKN